MSHAALAGTRHTVLHSSNPSGRLVAVERILSRSPRWEPCLKAAVRKKVGVDERAAEEGSRCEGSAACPAKANRMHLNGSKHTLSQSMNKNTDDSRKLHVHLRRTCLIQVSAVIQRTLTGDHVISNSSPAAHCALFTWLFGNERGDSE